MSEGVGSFSIQWGYLYSNIGLTNLYWWPSTDPDGNGNFADSDFIRMGLNSFGFYFNIPGGTNAPFWNTPDSALNQYVTNFSKQFYPDALKFTFTLYDSKGVFKDGQAFTHIVYLGD
jgi:hypothetical protein